jgi:ribosomal protein L22
MSPEKPATPEQGKPDEAEKLEEQAAEAKQADAKQADDAEQPKARKRRTPRKAKAPAAEAKDDGEEQKPAAKRARRKAPAKAPAAEAKDEGEEQAKDAEDGEVQRQASEAAQTARKAARGSGGGKPVARRKAVRARARYVRTSARKARMVCGHLRGKSVQEARAILAFTPREVARDWSKLLESAVANAESNHELLEDDLVVREAYADEGPTIKRFRPRAMGRATAIRKRTSHLTITLSPRPDQQTNKRHR